MTKTEVGFIGVNAAELEWRDDTDVLKLPEGAQVKVLMRDSPRNLATLLGKFAPGYIEPAHVHRGTHAVPVV